MLLLTEAVPLPAPFVTLQESVSSSASPACRVRVPFVSSFVESSGSDSVMAGAVFPTKDQAEAACAVDVPELSVSVT